MNEQPEAVPLPIPSAFRCPITDEVMEDPVRTVTGNVFERAAIAEWFRLGHQTDPLTNQQMPSLVLIPDRPFREAIKVYMRLRPDVRTLVKVDQKHAAAMAQKAIAQHAVAMAQKELLEKQGEARAQAGFGFGERLRRFLGADF